MLCAKSTMWDVACSDNLVSAQLYACRARRAKIDKKNRPEGVCTYLAQILVPSRPGVAVPVGICDPGKLAIQELGALESR